MASDRESLLDLPTHDALAKVIRIYLRDATRGLARLEKPVDPRRLHAFRVAIRRLRSLLRAYRPWLGQVAGRKVTRRLRKLTQATGAARDADVGIQWLLSQRNQLARDERPGFNWLLRRLQVRRRRIYKTAARRLRRDLAAATQRVGNRMGDAGRQEPQPFRATFLDRLEPAVRDLREQVGAITGADDVKNIHRSRIRVKRLRYLVEPLRNECAEARAVVRPLKRMQNLLGELHDMQVLEEEIAQGIEEAAVEKARRLHRLSLEGSVSALASERRRDESLGLLVLVGRARERRGQVFADFDQEWITNRRYVLRTEVRALRAVVGPAIRINPPLAPTRFSRP